MEISSRIKQKMDIEEHNEFVAYYEYLRSMTELTQLSYWIGNPSVEIISGKILLEPLLPIKTQTEPQNYQLYLKQILKANHYKLQAQQPVGESQSLGQFQNISQFQPIQQTQISGSLSKSQFPCKNITSRCLVLCGIPNSKSPSEVLQTPCIGSLSHLITQIRVIKTVHIKYYGMLLLIKDNLSAGEFFNEVFGTEYSDLEMQRILVRQVSQISLSFSELSMEGGNNQMNLLRAINDESQYLPPQNIFMTFHYDKLKQNQSQNMNENQSNQKWSNQKQSPNQLVCAICFEECNRHAISILCGHYFDLACLQKWSEQTCPLCRYHQQPPIIKFCQKCNQCEGLWVCLICGSRLCCGVTNDILGEDSHIYDHFKQTSHSLSMELQTKFLFDAKIPAFLHQKFYRDLLRNRSENSRLMQEKNIEENLKKDKITQQIQQYEQQVAQQMKRQRLYFQEQLNQSLKSHRNTLAKKRQQVEQLRAQIEGIQMQQKENSQQLSVMEKNCEKKGKQLQIVRQLIKIKERQVEEKRKQMSQNQKMKLGRVKELQEEIKERKEEILNYRKNLILREKWSEKLKGQQIADEIHLPSQKLTKNKKKK